MKYELAVSDLQLSSICMLRKSALLAYSIYLGLWALFLLLPTFPDPDGKLFRDFCSKCFD